MNFLLQFELPGLPTMSNLRSGRSHWRYADRERLEWQKAVVVKVGNLRPPRPLKKFKLTLTRFSFVAPDYDGLVRGFKSVVDGLKYAGVIDDDKLANTGTWDCRWERAPKSAGKIQVIVQGEVEWKEVANERQ